MHLDSATPAYWVGERIPIVLPTRHSPSKARSTNTHRISLDGGSSDKCLSPNFSMRFFSHSDDRTCQPCHNSRKERHGSKQPTADPRGGSCKGLVGDSSTEGYSNYRPSGPSPLDPILNLESLGLVSLALFLGPIGVRVSCELTALSMRLRFCILVLDAHPMPNAQEPTGTAECIRVQWRWRC